MATKARKLDDENEELRKKSATEEATIKTLNAEKNLAEDKIQNLHTLILTHRNKVLHILGYLGGNRIYDPNELLTGLQRYVFEEVCKFKEEDGKLTEQMDKVKKALLEYCKEQGVDSVKTSAGLFYRSAKTRYWTSDWSNMHEFVLEHEAPELLDKRLNQTNMKQFLEENPDLVPKGLNVDSEYVVSVRRK